MMKFVSKVVLANMLCLSSLSASAEEPPTFSNPTAQLATYLLNFGQYLGFNLVKPALALAQLSPLTIDQIKKGYAFDALLGSIPMNSMADSLSNFVGSNYPNAQTLNDLANNAFPNYNSGGKAESGSVAANEAIDQSTTPPTQTTSAGVYTPNTPQGPATYLKDPVSQAIFNILGTPDYTQCLDSNGNWKQGCAIKYQNKVMTNVIGTIPNQPDYFNFTYNAPIIPQLNGNTLIGPLMYSTNSSSGDIPQPTTGGLSAQNQAQEVANFIRYVSGQVAPTPFPSSDSYKSLYSSAIAATDPTSPNYVANLGALTTLNNYFTSLRIYAAQTSVPMSNLYYMMARRMPQTVNTTSSNVVSPNSEAQTEFTQATWRLYNPNGSTISDGSGGSPNDEKCPTSGNWVSCINNSSSTRVQKEMAILLAEINYQMYLDRQIQERLLMTNSILLLQNLKSSQPTPPSSSDASTATTNSN